MFSDILDIVKSALTDAGASGVYSGYDAVFIGSKPKGIFTVVEISSFESSAPIYTYSKTYTPFKAGISIKVTAPEDCSMDRLLEYYSEYIEPAVDSMSCLTCNISGTDLRFDSNIRRLVLTVRLSAAGISAAERSRS